MIQGQAAHPMPALEGPWKGSATTDGTDERGMVVRATHPKAPMSCSSQRSGLTVGRTMHGGMTVLVLYLMYPVLLAGPSAGDVGSWPPGGDPSPGPVQRMCSGSESSSCTDCSLSPRILARGGRADDFRPLQPRAWTQTSADEYDNKVRVREHPGSIQPPSATTRDSPAIQHRRTNITLHISRTDRGYPPWSSRLLSGFVTHGACIIHSR